VFLDLNMYLGIFSWRTAFKCIWCPIVQGNRLRHWPLCVGGKTWERERERECARAQRNKVQN
jgi:hypothetical protein